MNLGDAVKALDALAFQWLRDEKTGIAHAVAGRRSLCGKFKVPRNWVFKGRRDGAVCISCSITIRDRAALRRLYKLKSQ